MEGDRPSIWTTIAPVDSRLSGPCTQGRVERCTLELSDQKWRVLYVVEGDRFEVLVLEVNPHEY